MFGCFQANKNLDMSINASNNFNLNITWSFSSTGEHTNTYILSPLFIISSFLSGFQLFQAKYNL